MAIAHRWSFESRLLVFVRRWDSKNALLAEQALQHIRFLVSLRGAAFALRE